MLKTQPIEPSLVNRIGVWCRDLPSFRIVYDPNCLQETDERLFPASRHRSARVHKKLVKRLGGEFRKAPCIMRVNDLVVAHPAFRAELEAKSQ